MIIHLAADHAGFEHKQAVSAWLLGEGYEVVDHGADAFDPEDDFTDYISRAVAVVSKNPRGTRGIIFGGSGQGEAMLANRYPGIRAAVFYGGEDSIPTLSRQHNDSNVLSIGARFVGIDTVKKVTWEWLHTESLEQDKYHRRNQKIEDIANELHS